jgi:hypothetical protein
VSDPGRDDPWSGPAGGLDVGAGEATGGSTTRFVFGLLVLVLLMLFLVAAVHPSGVEGCGGG